MRMSKALRTLRADSFGANRNSCFIDIISGTRPSAVGTSLNGGVILISFRGLSPFGTTVDGVFTANVGILSVNGLVTGTAGWYRIRRSSGTTIYQDGLVSGPGGGGDMIIGDINIVAGELVDFVRYVETEGNAD